MASKSEHVEIIEVSGTAAPESILPAAAADYSRPLTKAEIMASCVANGFYRTPHCNDKLYLHYKGFDKIDALQEYIEVLVLWLEGNAISVIEELQHCPKLKQLYLQENCIRRIGDGLRPLVELDLLNLSDNYITELDGLDALQQLTTLRLKNNKLKARSDFEHLVVLSKLSCLDLSNNLIEDGPALIEVLQQLPGLRSLYLTGNPCVRSITNYRRTIISKLPMLRYLDDKPVFDDERRLVTAWAAGGMAGEKAEKEVMRREEEERVQERVREFRRFVRGTAPPDSTEGAAPSGTTETSHPVESSSAAPGRSDDDEEDHDSNPTDDDEDDAVWTPAQPPALAASTSRADA